MLADAAGSPVTKSPFAKVLVFEGSTYSPGPSSIYNVGGQRFGPGEVITIDSTPISLAADNVEAYDRRPDPKSS